MVRHRYSAGIQRAKGFLELAAALYDTSLSFKATRGAGNADIIQTDTRLGTSIRISISTRRSQRKGIVELSLGVGGFRELKAVARRKLSVLWLNPSVYATLAFKGTGPFSEPLPLRTIAVFPSYDFVGFAVRESAGISSLAQIGREKIPLRLSTGRRTRPPFALDATMFSVTSVTEAAGFTLADIRSWGGTIQSVSRPSHPDRRAAVEQGVMDAIFDEGVLSWGQGAIDHGFRFLSVDGASQSAMVALGYRRTLISKSRFQGMREDVETLDFSGWPMIVHADMPDEIAYALCEAIEASKDIFPTDNFKPLDVAQLCADDEETPRDVPLHPGAERFYRERGYLK